MRSWWWGGTGSAADMRVRVLEVEWHEGRAPIYSVHFSSKSNLLASGGQDTKVLLWRLDANGTTVSHAAMLDEHVATVNCVRWSPQGTTLASATDGGENYGGQLLIWAQEPTTQVWRVVCRCQVQRDLYDICWSPDGSKIAAVGTDTKIKIFDVHTGKELEEYSPHSSYVQGVAWDPLNEFIVSQSMDRSLCVHTFKPKNTRKLRDMPNGGADPQQLQQQQQGVASFLDEKATSYFRRLTFTCDGELLICPTAAYTVGENTTNCSLLFTRDALSNGVPSAVLPVTSHASIAVACSPVRYEHHGKRLIDTDYACIYAVVTQFMVLVYSTQKREPLCVVSDLHPAAFTDVAWSNDGQQLVLSSMEGFCSIVQFEEGDLPRVLSKPATTVPDTQAPPTPASLTSSVRSQNPSSTPPVVNMLTARKKKPKAEPISEASKHQIPPP